MTHGHGTIASIGQTDELSHPGESIPGMSPRADSDSTDTAVIVSGHLLVSPDHRATYLDGCVEVVRMARQAPGCLDFTISADPLDPGRINVLERWTTREAVEAFRGSGPSSDQQGMILTAEVNEYDVAGTRSLTG